MPFRLRFDFTKKCTKIHTLLAASGKIKVPPAPVRDEQSDEAINWLLSLQNHRVMYFVGCAEARQ